ncbi:hypothetical protein Scep_026815 [Stephania cephalantha]|uniref:Neprosin PEP catalytic domain-containing protein n=1 Tax=Stephania cephalantha TaxID=152367 RepID=A0AAP0EKV4_9MAGN
MPISRGVHGRLAPLRPTSFPKEFDKKPSSNIFKRAILKQVDCPEGTVPIKRVGKEELRAAIFFSESILRSRRNEIHTQAFKDPGLFQAAVTKLSNGVYRGAKADISVEKLNNIAAGHYSASLVWVTDDPNGYTQSLWAGWMTDESGGCFNTYCSGFVVTSKSNPLGVPLRGPGAQKYVVGISIAQDKGTGHWWLNVNGESIGYWPKGLIPALDDGASNLIWGSVTYGGSREASSPMGNGILPDASEPLKSGILTSMGVVSSSPGGFVDAPVDQSGIKVDCNTHYGVTYFNDKTTAIAYGGPGGLC